MTEVWQALQSLTGTVQYHGTIIMSLAKILSCCVTTVLSINLLLQRLEFDLERP